MAISLWPRTEDQAASPPQASLFGLLGLCSFPWRLAVTLMSHTSRRTTRCAQEVCSTHPHLTLIPILNPHFSNESQFFLSVSRLYFLSKQFPRCNSCPEVKTTRAVTRSGRWVFSFLQDHTMQKTGCSGANCKITLPSESKH
jgi:hypothetical protein